MKLKVRLKGIVHDIVMATDSRVPPPLLTFMANFKQGAFVPDGFLTPFELNRIKVDDYGAIVAPLSQD